MRAAVTALLVAGALALPARIRADAPPVPSPAPASAATAARARGPNLVLVTIDTLRADHLGIYGYARDTSPHLDALAREGTWFERVYSASATTGAAHASLFTSLPPKDHGVYANRQRFPAALPSLMGVLRAKGWIAGAFVSSVVVGRKSGLQDHFDHFDDELTTLEGNREERYERPAEQTIAAAEAWLRAIPAGRPFFLWVHLIDPHGPYRAPVDPDRYVNDRFAKRIGRDIPLGAHDFELGRIPRYQILDGRTDADFYVARYDAEIRYADAALGGFLAELGRRGLAADTLVAVTADHGETLAEPGHRRVFSHGQITYEETVRIPLVIREPGGARRLAAVDRTAPVSSLDVAPTLLALLGLEAPAGFQGRNLLAAPADPRASMYSMGAYGSENLERGTGTQFSLRRGPWRLIVNSQDGREELYDHRSDPTESRDLASSSPPELPGLRTDLDRVIAGRPAAVAAPPIPPEQAESLRALGYVE